MNAPITARAPFAHLPDVARGQASPVSTGIDWVGMNDIALPISLEQQACQAQVDIAIDLPDPAAKGIHMSRLYGLLQSHLTSRELTPERLRGFLQAAIGSHGELGSAAARITIRTHLLLSRPALISELSGWKRYPVTLEAEVNPSTGEIQIRAEVTVDYSSTCPCSAALSRQLLQDAFIADWQSRPLSVEAVAQWLAEHGSYATPHSQRSQAQVSVVLPQNSANITTLIDHIETALCTPVQTAVKRVDEQAFARLNGSNLMYVEDAVRRLQAKLTPLFTQAHIQVIHHESLHQHDATASIFSDPRQ